MGGDDEDPVDEKELPMEMENLSGGSKPDEEAFLNNEVGAVPSSSLGMPVPWREWLSTTRAKIAIGIVCGLVVIFIVVMIILGVKCMLNNCPAPPPTEPPIEDTCDDCQFKTWEKYTDKERYSATSCGDPLHVTWEQNTLSVDSSADDTSGEKGSVTDTRVKIAVPGLAGANTIELYWEAAKSARSQEFVKLVFSDTGDRYSGCGEFGSSVFRPKPSAGSDDYVLWTEKDNPIYLPYYLSRNEFASFCMFVDAKGAPVHITVQSTVTEWVIYQYDKVYFYIYSGNTPYEALKECSAKWKELYPSPDASWTNDYIIGSLTPGEMKTASETANVFATHYIMSYTSFSLKSDQIEITDVAEYDKYETVFFPWDANLNLQSDPGFTLTTEDGFYKSGAAESDSYIPDYSNSAAKTAITTAVSKTSYAGLLLRDGVLARESSEKCADYLKCSKLHKLPGDYRDSSEICPGADFGDEPMFQRHNTYDASRRAALQSDSTRVIESVATPGTTHFYRDVELTADGLKICYNNILNLHLIGVRAVTCNMCGGFSSVTLEDAQPLSAELKSLCFKFAQLSLVMPYIVMYNKDKSPPILTVATDASFKVDMKPVLDMRTRLKYYLDAAYRTAITNKEPFVYTPSVTSNDVKYQGQSNGVMIGNSLYMVLLMEGDESGHFNVAFPSGVWYSNPDVSQKGTYGSGNKVLVIEDTEDDIKSLLYFKLESIFVMWSLERPGEYQVHVQIFVPRNPVDPITHKFEYYDPDTQLTHETNIVLNPNEKSITFTYSAPENAVTQDITIAKIEVYLWPLAEKNAEDWITYHTLEENGQNYYNIVFDYLNVGYTDSRHSIFETWTQKIENPGGS